jgi:hypothetical protein
MPDHKRGVVGVLRTAAAVPTLFATMQINMIKPFYLEVFGDPSDTHLHLTEYDRKEITEKIRSL